MQRKRAKRLIIGAAVTLAGALGAFAVIGPASAAISDITMDQKQTFTSDNGSESGTTINGDTGASDTTSTLGGFSNMAIPATLTGAGTPGAAGKIAAGVAGGGATTTSVATGTGNYRMMTNLWNNNTTWNCGQITGQRATDAACNGGGDSNATSSLIMSVNGSKTQTTTDTQYEYNAFNANSYFPGGRPGNTANCPQTGTTNGVVDTNLPCHWTPTQAHFPSSYPAMYKGCNFGQCSFTKTAAGLGQNSAALPTPLSSVVSLQSRWVVNLPTANANGNPTAPGDGVYDVAYDIWLDRGDNPQHNPNASGALETLPDHALNLEQNNGAEVMLWINNSGYAGPGGPDGTPGHVITPAGKFIGTYGDSTGQGWDVWIGRQNMPDLIDPTTGSPTKGGPLGTFKCHYSDLVTPQTNDHSFNNASFPDVPSSQNSHCAEWNIVTYVRQTGTRDFNGDAAEFLDNALNYNGGDTNLATNVQNPSMSLANLQNYLGTVCPQQPTASPNFGNTAKGQCISPDWFLSSVQTGMEVWNLPSNGGSANAGQKLGTKFFSVNPLTVLSTSTNPGTTGRWMRAVDGSSPTKYHAVIHYNDTFVLSYSGCSSPTAGAAATYTISTTGPSSTNMGTMTQAVANSGLWESTPVVPPLNPGHDNTSITISGIPTCGEAAPAGNLFVDPSGHVVTKAGMAVNGATVTLSECESGTCHTPVLADITPKQTSEVTPDPGALANGSGPGSFRWDVAAGHQWTVTASAPGCTTQTIGPLNVPPPQVGLLIVLDCATNAPGIIAVSGGTYTPPPGGGGGGGGLPTQVVIRGGGIPPHGYCADVFVTNNTSSPVTWNTSFTVPGNQHIAQAWNMAFTQSGNPNVATNVHADAGSQSWNAVLQPGQTTHDNGFCTVFS